MGRSAPEDPGPLRAAPNIPTDDLLSLCQGVSSFAQVEKRLLAVRDPAQRRRLFADLCGALVALDPAYRFVSVHQGDRLPHSVRKRMRRGRGKLDAIDGVGVSPGGRLTAWHACLAPVDAEARRTLNDFLRQSLEADWRLIASNARDIPAEFDDAPRHGRILAHHLRKLPPDLFDRLRLYLLERIVRPAPKKVPHATQLEALREADRHYRAEARGILVLPCGTGKTLAALWIAERSGARRILFMLPSLALVSQTLREWAANCSWDSFRYLCLCSDPSVGIRDEEGLDGKVCESDVPVTTDPEEAARFLSTDSPEVSVLICTYQSSRALAEAAAKAGAAFDLAFYDEAHRTATPDAGVWSLALRDDAVRAAKRVFMTATPKIYSPAAKKRAQEADAEVCSMDDHSLYGVPFYELSFGDAIRRGHITDYKVVVMLVSDDDVERAIRYTGKVVSDGRDAQDARTFARNLVLLDAMERLGIRKAFTFHSRVAGAKELADPQAPGGLLRALRLARRDPATAPKVFHVNGAMAGGEREEVLADFRAAERAVVTNARCLGEGVDIPAVDCVAFFDRRDSVIDIVQAAGRALRVADWKDLGYVLLPVIVREGESPEAAVAQSEFDVVWQVLDAMAGQDERLRAVVETMRAIQAKGEEGSGEWEEASELLGKRLEIASPFLPTVERAAFVRKIQSRAVELTASLWSFWYGLTLAHLKRHRTANARRTHRTPEGYALGNWQATQRSLRAKALLAADREKRLSDVGFSWNQEDVPFEAGLGELLRFKAENSGFTGVHWSYRTPDGFRLGSWLWRGCRTLGPEGFTDAQIARLEAAGYPARTERARTEKKAGHLK